MLSGTKNVHPLVLSVLLFTFFFLAIRMQDPRLSENKKQKKKSALINILALSNVYNVDEVMVDLRGSIVIVWPLQLVFVFIIMEWAKSACQDAF